MRRHEVGYSIVKVVTADWSDGRVYPAMADPAVADGMLVEREDLDGPSVMTVPASAIRVNGVTAGGSTRLLEYKGVKAFLYVTDSRVVLACENYDKGSTYLGIGDIGAPVAVAATAMSRLRARARRKGKMLTGQIRYQWLSEARAAPKNGLLYPNRLRLACSTHDDKEGRRPYVLDVTLADQNRNSLEVALEIIHRAATFKLRWYDGISEETRTELDKLAVAPPLERPEKGKVTGHTLPYYHYVRSSAAVPPKYAEQAQQS
jgi:hypothetical protein